MPTTIARLLAAIERAAPRPVHLYCHPDDVARVTAACELLLSVRVVAHELVPAGKLWIGEDLPDMEES